jgi:hypothetical protein
VVESAFRRLIEREQPAEEEAQRLLSVAADLRWYAAHVGAERWNVMPRSNKWSFEQNLYWLVKKAGAGAVPNPVQYLTDRGKYCVGLASEILALFENNADE